MDRCELPSVLTGEGRGAALTVVAATPSNQQQKAGGAQRGLGVGGKNCLRGRRCLDAQAQGARGGNVSITHVPLKAAERSQLRRAWAF